MKARITLSLALLAGGAGCHERSAPAAAPPAGAPAATPATQKPASLDARTPVPLLPMMAEHQRQQMRGHLAAVQEVVAALAKGDFEGVEAAAQKLGYSDSMAQMCTHMGAAAPGFTPTAITFHKTADTIGAAAKKRDGALVLSALNATLGTCVGCHAA